MNPLAFGGLGVPELLIILAVVLLLFGGSRLAGLGKSTGRALKEFKEETKGLGDKKGAAAPTAQPMLGPDPGATATGSYQQPPPTNTTQNLSDGQEPSVQDPSGSDLRKDA
jgi:sec-independent protein translocase protein TatA